MTLQRPDIDASYLAAYAARARRRAICDAALACAFVAVIVALWLILET